MGLMDLVLSPSITEVSMTTALSMILQELPNVLVQYVQSTFSGISHPVIIELSTPTTQPTPLFTPALITYSNLSKFKTSGFSPELRLLTLSNKESKLSEKEFQNTRWTNGFITPSKATPVLMLRNKKQAPS